MTTLNNPNPAYRGPYRARKSRRIQAPLIRRTGANIVTQSNNHKERSRRLDDRYTISKSRFQKFKVADPFGTKQSAFATAYSTRRLYCDLSHGSIKQQLRWNRAIADIPYDPVLVLFCEGLIETRHPYVFVSRAGVKDLLCSDAEDRVVPLLPRIVPSIRAALMSRNNDTFVAGCKALNQLSGCVGPNLNGHILPLLVPLNKHSNHRRHSNLVTDVFFTLCMNGGKDVIALIKKKVPAFIPPV